MLDLRSDLCVRLQGSADYSRLLVTDGPAASAAELAGVRPGDLLAKPAVDAAAAGAMLAGLWLWHDDLDAAHAIVQQSPADVRRGDAKAGLTVLPAGGTPARDAAPDDAEMTLTYAFWHAVIHRREGDFGNAKYWYAQVRGHPLLASLGEQVRGTVAHAPADKRLLKLSVGDYNGAAFVDFVQEVHESPSDPRYGIAVALQELEWRVLFDHCTRAAAGA